MSPYIWVIWATELDITKEGNYRIIAIATDKAGRVQTREVREHFPNSAGYHMVDTQTSS